MKWQRSAVGGILGGLRCACAGLLAGVLPVWAGPNEDADAAFKAGRMAEAESAYTQALATKPRDASSLIKRGRARQALGRKNDAAADFDQAVQLAPDNPDVWHYRGIFRYSEKDYKGALDDLNKNVELAPQSAPAFESRAAVQVVLKDYNAAIIDSTRAIQIRPNFITALNWRGFAWQQLKDPESALRDFEAVIKLDPRNTYALTHRAMVYEAQGLKEKAIQEYRIVLAIDPKQKDAANHLAKLQNPPISKKPPAVQPSNSGAQGATSVASAQPVATLPIVSAASPEARSQAPQTATVSAIQTQVLKTGASIVPSASNAGGSGDGNPGPHGVSGSKVSVDSGSASTNSRAQPPASAAPESSKAPPLAASNTQAAPTSAGATETREPLPRGGYYKLIRVKIPAFDLGRYETNWRDYEARHPGETMRGQFQGAGPAAQWSYDETSRSNDAHPQQIQHGDSLAWSVPDALIPGKSAHFHLGSTVRGNDARFMGNSGHVVLDTAFGRIYLVAVYNYPPGHMPRPHKNEADDFDLTIPAELPSLFANYRSLPNPNQTPTSVSIRDPAVMEEVVKSPLTPAQEQTPNSLKAPGEVGIVNSCWPLYSWVNADLVVTVVNDDFGGAALNLAEYTYHWVGPPSIPGSAESLLEISLEPGPKENLQADGKDGILVRARVNPKDASDTAAANAATAGITFAAEGTDSRWVDLHYKPEVRDGWMVIQVQASNPDAARKGYIKPPAIVTVTAHAQKSGSDIAQPLDIPIAPDAEIDAKPDIVEFTSGSGDSAKVAVGIDNAGSEKWEIKAEYDKNSRKVAAAEIKQVDGKSATLSLKEAGLDPQHDGTNKEQALLKITAEQKGRATVERDIKVNVYQEGLFVSTVGRDPDKGIFVLNGDGKARAPTEIDVRVYTKDPKTKKVVNVTAKEGSLKKLTVERLDPKGTPASNVLEVGKFDGGFSKVRRVNDPAAVLSLSLTKEVPADGRIVPCDFRISYADEEGASFSSIITVGVQTTSDGPGGSNWQVELDKCQEVITRFVPATYYPKMQAMLDKRKMTLGPEGLAQLRHKIWNAAAELTLGEGGEGYAKEAAWAGAITDVLEWSQWAGDMAFSAAVGSWTGPYGAIGADLLKGSIVSAINAYQDGETPQQWAYENLISIRGMLRGQVVDPSVFEKMGVESKTKAWAIYLGYHFLANLYDGQTVVEALKNTGKEATNYVIGGWLSEQVKQNAGKDVTSWVGEKGQEAKTAVKNLLPKAQNPQAAAVPKKAAPTAETAPIKKAAAPEAETPADETTPAKTPEASPASAEEASAAKPAAEGESVAKPAAEGEPPPAPSVESVPAQESDSAALVRSRTTQGPDGRLFAHQDDVLTIMKDPTMVRALKNAPPEVQEAFSNTREQIYEQHDSVVEQYVKANVDGMSKRVVKVREFRTPGATGASLNTDRDYRVCYFAGWDKNGLEQWIEIPRKKWQDKSYETFAKLTGCPDGYEGGPEKWAAAHQQLATDKSHAEASVAFSDQLVYNKETKQMEKIRVVSNIQQVLGDQQKQKWNSETKQWDTVPEDPALAPVAKPDSDNTKIDLADPQGLGLMYQAKVLDARQPQEAFVQANKAVETLVALRKAYEVKGSDTGTLAPNVEAGMKAVAEVVAKLKADPNCRDPKAVADAQNTLRQNGFPNIDAFMDKLKGQFESFKNM